MRFQHRSPRRSLARPASRVYHTWLISFVQEQTRKIRGRSAKREPRPQEPSPGTQRYPGRCVSNTVMGSLTCA